MRYVAAVSILSMTAIMLGNSVVRALPVPPDPIPVSRLVSSLEERISRNSADLQAVYTLGRVHYFAFAGTTDTLNTVMKFDPSDFRLYDFFNAGRGSSAVGPTSAPMSDAEKVAHVKAAIANLTRAVTLSAGTGDGRYELGLACAYDDG